MKKTSLLLLVLPLLLVACTQKEKDAIAQKLTEDENTIVLDLGKAIASEKVYAAYEEGVIGNGESSLLFFAATWCPACQAHDKDLQVWYESEDFDVSVYKVDYDTSGDLKAHYGVVQQDTFVLIDGNGETQEVLSFPSEADLRDMLRG